jgi:hypothetical protein
VPWSAVYVIADFDGNGAVWQDDIPSDLPIERTTPDGVEPGPPPEPPKAPEPPAGKKPRPSHLKLVK